MPRSNNSVRKLPVPGDFVEAVFRPENFRIFSDDFRPVPAGKRRKLTGIHRKKSGQFPVGILLPCSSDFRCFPAGSGDFRESIQRDPVPGIIDLGEDKQQERVSTRENEIVVECKSRRPLY